MDKGRAGRGIAKDNDRPHVAPAQGFCQVADQKGQLLSRLALDERLLDLDRRAMGPRTADDANVWALQRGGSEIRWEKNVATWPRSEGQNHEIKQEWGAGNATNAEGGNSGGACMALAAAVIDPEHRGRPSQP